MTQLPKNGSKIILEKVNAIQGIENKNYILKQNTSTGQFYLLEQPGFELPPTLYGDTTERTNLVLQRYEKYKKNLGVLLSGIKGTGKSLLAKTICFKSNMPVIIIGCAFDSQSIVELLNNVIEKPCILFIDEIDKVYKGKENKDKLLSLLDGLQCTHPCLFLMTCNNMFDLHDCMINRPGRCHYLFEYDTLSTVVAEEFIEDNLEFKEFETEIKQFSHLYYPLSIDILKAIVEEVNFQKKGLHDVLNVLNVSFQSAKNEYDVVMIDKIENEEHKTVAYFNPLKNKSFNLKFKISEATVEEMKFYQKHKTRSNNAWEDYFVMDQKSIELWTKLNPEKRNLFHYQIQSMYDDRKNYFVKNVCMEPFDYTLKTEKDQLSYENDERLVLMKKKPSLNFYTQYANKKQNTKKNKNGDIENSDIEDSDIEDSEEQFSE